MGIRIKSLEMAIAEFYQRKWRDTYTTLTGSSEEDSTKEGELYEWKNLEEALAAFMWRQETDTSSDDGMDMIGLERWKAKILEEKWI
jgi:hypothetical protein